MSKSSECPNFGKKSLVQHSQDVYQCLSCDFRKDFSQPQLGLFAIFIIVAIAVFMAKLTQPTERKIDLSPSNSNQSVIQPKPKLKEKQCHEN